MPFHVSLTLATQRSGVVSFRIAAQKNVCTRYGSPMRTDMSQADDAMRRYARGEVSAFPVVYHALVGPLRRYVRARLRGDAGLEEDIVQATFVRMHRARSRFDEGGHVLPWALIIARNLIIDAKRSGKADICEELGDDSPDSAAPSAEEALSTREDAQRLMSGLEKLTPEQQEAMWLMRVEGLSAPEAAKVVGIDATALRVRLHRATARLRDLLGITASAARKEVQ